MVQGTPVLSALFCVVHIELMGCNQCLCGICAENNTQVSLPFFIGLPSVKLSTHNLTVVEGKSITLYCNATGTPSPIVSWVFNNIISKHEVRILS